MNNEAWEIAHLEGYTLRIMKINRRAVYEKYDGHCAYCGRAMEFGKMQVDHYWPQFLNHFKPGLEPDRFTNLMRSCAKCNNHKYGMRPEVWRSELGKQVARLRKNAQFDRALRFGQIEIQESPIVFYFERYNKSIQRIKTADFHVRRQ